MIHFKSEKFTKHKLLQALRTGNKRELDPLVMELDPDAPNRKERDVDGKGLASDDAVWCILLATMLPFMYFGSCRTTRRL